ncbi:MAG: hypothetical protein AB1782_18745 [Cyanobacteriota bacterium]
MPNIHNNEIAQRGAVSRGRKPAGTDNESNGMGSPGYLGLEEEKKNETEDVYIDRSESLMNALSGLATINYSKIVIKNKKPVNSN